MAHDTETVEIVHGMPGEDGGLIVFDGVCVMCSGFARWVNWADTAGKFKFATAQSSLGESLYRRHGLRTDVYETSLVLIGGVAYQRLDSMIAVMEALGWRWRLPALLLKALPSRLRDRLYGMVADNRYALFGKKDSCDIPSGSLRDRIVG